MVKRVTDKNQSQQLTEAGIYIKPDMWQSPNGGIASFPILSSDGPCDCFECWSLTELLDYLPQEIVNDDEEACTLQICKDSETTYYIYYRNEWTDAIEIESETNEELIDCVVEMLLTLLKNDRI